tara:strand:+ start:2759 stop:3274 length:516 start_codon:yes stop_codon:yes gene_type:complete
MQITILMNERSSDALPFDQVKKAIELKQSSIVTYCLDFASFHYLDLGYEVEVVRLDPQTEKVTSIVLSELLENKRPYTAYGKEIRRAHNIQKMIKGNALLFLPPVSATFFKVEYRDPETEETMTEHHHFEPLVLNGQIVASAKKTAEDYAYTKADKGWYRVTNVIDVSLLA